MSWFWRLFGFGGGEENAEPTPAANLRRTSSGTGSSHGIRKGSSQEIHLPATRTSQTGPPPTSSSKDKLVGGDGSTQSVSLVGGESAHDGGVTSMEEIEPERESWGSKVGYILTLVGYAVGFGNIWRFPALMHKTGGAAFLIPYGIMLAFAGIPIFFLELAVGQRLRKGALGSWNEISPYLGGLGLACGCVCFMQELYYNTLVAWVLMYLTDSFRAKLSWSTCDNLANITGEKLVYLPGDNKSKAPAECVVSNQASKYYYYRRMLDISESITDPGNFNPWMLLYITLAWLIVLAILIKGIKSSEKVVYVTAIFPYLVLLTFFGANFYTDGWREGYQFLFKPDWSVLLKSETWLKAGSQIFFSLGLGYGCLIVFASYLPSDNNCHRDAVAVSIINCATSVFASVVLFPVFGSIGKNNYKQCLQKRLGSALMVMHLAKESDLYKESLRDKWYDEYKMVPEYEGFLSEIRRIKGPQETWDLTHRADVHAVNWNCSDMETYIRNSGSGTGLVFIGFAEAVSRMPVPPIWSILFFFMLLTLGIDTSFGTLEGAIAVVVDLKIVKLPRWAITCSMVAILNCLTLVFCWGWGLYIQTFLDEFVANWTLLIVGFFETIGIAWVYGLAKFSYDIKLMTGSRPNMFILICWKFITPLLLLSILIMSIVQKFTSAGPFAYEVYDKHIGDLDKSNYPIGIIILGYCLMLTVIIWVPLQAVLVFFMKSMLRKETPAFFPEEELRAERQLGEEDEEEFGKLDQLVMGKSIDDFKENQRRSRGSLPSPHPSVNNISISAGNNTNTNTGN